MQGQKSTTQLQRSSVTVDSLFDLDVFDHEDSDYDSDARRNIRPEALSASLTFASSSYDNLPSLQQVKGQEQQQRERLQDLRQIGGILACMLTPTITHADDTHYLCLVQLLEQTLCVTSLLTGVCVCGVVCLRPCWLTQTLVCSSSQKLHGKEPEEDSRADEMPSKRPTKRFWTGIPSTCQRSMSTPSCSQSHAASTTRQRSCICAPLTSTHFTNAL